MMYYQKKSIDAITGKILDQFEVPMLAGLYVICDDADALYVGRAGCYTNQECNGIRARCAAHLTEALQVVVSHRGDDRYLHMAYALKKGRLSILTELCSPDREREVIARVYEMGGRLYNKQLIPKGCGCRSLPDHIADYWKHQRGIIVDAWLQEEHLW
jgi:hypothetical protein